MTRAYIHDTGMMFLFKPFKKETKLTDAYRFPPSSPVFHLGVTSRIINDAFRKMELFGRFPLFSSPIFDIEQCFAPRSPFLLLSWDRDDATRRVSRRETCPGFSIPRRFSSFSTTRGNERRHVEELRFTKQEKERRRFLRGEERAVRSCAGIFHGIQD